MVRGQECRNEKSEFGFAFAGADTFGPPQMQALPTPARGGGGSRRGAGGSHWGGGSGQGKPRGATSPLEELMRRQGVDEAWTALEEMQRQGVPADKYTVSRMLMKTVGDGRYQLNPARVYRAIGLVEAFIETQPQDVDGVLFNALLESCCRLKDMNRLEANLQRMRKLNITASPVTLGILVKTYGLAGNLQKVLQVWDEMEYQRDQANAVTYGCMIDACVKCGHLQKAVEIFGGMRSTGKHRNTILYTTMIKGYGMEKDLRSALELFYDMAKEGVPYNTITYNSIIDACVKCGDLATAETVLHELASPVNKLEPDLITFSTLLKGYCQVGELNKALELVQAIKARGLHCDELVYNTLMDGCVKADDVETGVGLFEEMVANGMQPSAITNSILARLYQRAGYEDDSGEAVAQLYAHHGLERPSGGDRGRRRGGRNGNNAYHASSLASHSHNSDVWGSSGASTPFGSPSCSPAGSPTCSANAPFFALEAFQNPCQDTPTSVATPGSFTMGSKPAGSAFFQPSPCGTPVGASGAPAVPPMFGFMPMGAHVQQEQMQLPSGAPWGGTTPTTGYNVTPGLPPWPIAADNSFAICNGTAMAPAVGTGQVGMTHVGMPAGVNGYAWSGHQQDAQQASFHMHQQDAQQASFHMHQQEAQQASFHMQALPSGTSTSLVYFEGAVNDGQQFFGQ